MVTIIKRNNVRHGWGFVVVDSDGTPLARQVECTATETECQERIARFIKGILDGPQVVRIKPVTGEL